VEGEHLDFLAHFGVAAAHEPLDGEDRPLGIGDGLALRDLTDEPLPVLGEGDHRGCGSGPFLVGDNGRLAALEHRDDRVRCSKIDADDS